jgi:hypothetical protein
MTQATVFKSAGTCTDTSLPILYRDTIIDPYTKYVYDALDTASWPSQAAPTTGQVISSLTNNAADASFLEPDLPGFSGGFVFTESAVVSPSGIATKTERIILPESAKIAASSVGFASAIWIKHTGGTAGKQMQIAGWHHGLTGPWGIYKQDNTYTLICDGNTTNRTGIAPDVVHQIVVGRVSNGAGGYQVRYYVDGVLVDADTGNATVSQPSTVPSQARIGYMPNVGTSSSIGATLNGKIYRAWLSDAETTVGVFTAAYLDALVAGDWADNRARFS